MLFLALGDLDGDRKPDVLTAARESRLLYFRRQPGPAVAWSEHSIPLPDQFRFGKAVTLADIDRAGQTDIVMTNRGNPKKRAVSWMSYRNTPTSGRWTVHRVSDARGVKFDLGQALDLDAMETWTSSPARKSTTWVCSGTRTRPSNVHGPVIVFGDGQSLAGIETAEVLDPVSRLAESIEGLGVKGTLDINHVVV